MSDSNTDVTAEEAKRDDDGNITKLNLKHKAGKHNYFTTIIVREGEARFKSFTPMRRSGEHAKKGTNLFGRPTAPTARFENCMQLLASARQYANDVYNFDVGRCIWLKDYEENDDE